MNGGVKSNRHGFHLLSPLLILGVVSFSLISPAGVGATELSLLGLFELTEPVAGDSSLAKIAAPSAEGRAELAAARLAVGHVNTARLLGKYKLKLFVNDTKVRQFFYMHA